MSMLAFFPWTRLRGTSCVGDFHLLEYKRGERGDLAPDDLAAADIVLGRYIDGKHPISHATLLQHSSQSSVTSDIPDEIHAAFFQFAELLAFSALSERQFFGINYCNRDNFQLVLQAFRSDDPGHGVSMNRRRRDGSTWISYPGDTLTVPRPAHVGPFDLEVSEDLLRALLACSADPPGEAIYQSIVLLIEANADRPDMPLPAEVVLSYSALEQILGVPGKNTPTVVEAFDGATSQVHEVPRADWPDHGGNSRAEKLLSDSATLREAWVRDFAATRGSLGHGHADGAYPALWNPSEHLLYAAHIVPLLIKSQLVGLGHYTLTSEDVAGLHAFEQLLAERHLEPREPGSSAVHRWSKILSKARFGAWIDEAAADLPADSESD